MNGILQPRILLQQNSPIMTAPGCKRYLDFAYSADDLAHFFAGYRIYPTRQADNEPISHKENQQKPSDLRNPFAPNRKRLYFSRHYEMINGKEVIQTMLFIKRYPLYRYVRPL